MKYPIGPESLAQFYKVKVNLSDKIVREFREKFPQNEPKQPQVLYDINVFNSNGMIPVVIIERPNAADRALEALQRGLKYGSSARKPKAKTPKGTNKELIKPTKGKQTNAKKSSLKKQKPSRPLFILPKWNKTEQSKKN